MKKKRNGDFKVSIRSGVYIQRKKGKFFYKDRSSSALKTRTLSEKEAREMLRSGVRDLEHNIKEIKKILGELDNSTPRMQ